jgi:PH (Pleckstrin Homology) domain-containing protein
VDNSDEGAYRFGPDRRLSAGYAVGALVAVATVALTNDAPGRLLFAIAAIILGAYAVTDFLFWPRVQAGRGGLVLHTPTVRGSFGWDQVQDVRADSRQRLGLRLVTLEIDVADTLVVLSRRSLGTDPERAAALIRFAAPH